MLSQCAVEVVHKVGCATRLLYAPDRSQCGTTIVRLIILLSPFALLSPEEVAKQIANSNCYATSIASTRVKDPPDQNIAPRTTRWGYEVTVTFVKAPLLE